MVKTLKPIECDLKDLKVKINEIISCLEENNIQRKVGIDYIEEEEEEEEETNFIDN